MNSNQQNVIFPQITNTTPIKVRYEEKMNPESVIYDINNKGLCIIFSHKTYSKHLGLGDLQGAVKDVERLTRCFEKLNFDVKKTITKDKIKNSYEDLSYDQIMSVMESVAKLKTKQLSCLVVVITTHGGEGGILAAYDRYYDTADIWKPLVGKLVGTPKLFFINACRGLKCDLGIEEESDGKKIPASFRLPSMADFLFMYSTFEGYLAWGSDTDGGWLIQALCEELEDKAGTNELVHILTHVNRRVALQYGGVFEGNIVAAMPQFSSMLTKFLYFKVI
ncbi:caspase-3-like [Arctopsyche grandis]|uniref:caspase-3-like n=1 Tax=Arctopsyche grandis TaxID=121162 RepID=UPI00406D90CD